MCTSTGLNIGAKMRVLYTGGHCSLSADAIRRQVGPVAARWWCEGTRQTRPLVKLSNLMRPLGLVWGELWILPNISGTEKGQVNFNRLELEA